MGFRELLEDLTRGVIRDRPNNIPLYLQRHFQELVEHQRQEREAERKRKEELIRVEAIRREEEARAEQARIEEERRLAEAERQRIAAEEAEIQRKRQ